MADGKIRENAAEPLADGVNQHKNYPRKTYYD
jgi:hypothetical protein